MTPAEKIAEWRSRTRYDTDGRDWVGALLDIAEAAVVVGIAISPDDSIRRWVSSAQDEALDNLAAKLAALGGG